MILINGLFIIQVFLVALLFKKSELIGLNIFFIIVFTLLLGLLALFAFVDIRKTRRRITINNLDFQVTIIVPVFNEERLIQNTLNKILGQKGYSGQWQIIVINDGSSDKSLSKIQDFSYTNPNTIELIDLIKNEGKKSALILGFNRAIHDVIITIDSDTILDEDSVVRLYNSLGKNYAAVCGYSKVLNKKDSILTRIQNFEYFISHELFKSFENRYDLIQCCPGCFTAYRKSSIEPIMDQFKESQIFSFPVDYGEDRYLTALLLSRGEKISYDRNAIVHTEVPVSLKAFVVQRKRWIKSWFVNTIFLFAQIRMFPMTYRCYLVLSFVFNILIISYLPLIVLHILTGNSLLLLYSLLIIFTYMLFELVTSKKVSVVMSILYLLLTIIIYSWLTLLALFNLKDRSWGRRPKMIDQ